MPRIEGGGAFQRDADMRGHFWRVGTVLFGVRGTGGGESVCWGDGPLTIVRALAKWPSCNIYDATG